MTTSTTHSAADGGSLPADYPGGGFAQWWRRSTRHGGTPAGRIVGLDVARGLAVLGMIVAHIADVPGLVWTEPATWGGIVHGRSSILFAVLAGLSIGLITAGKVRRTPDLLQARMKIVVRAALILLIGVGLEALDTGIAVILGVYALLFVAMLPFVTWSVRRLVGLTIGSAIAGFVIYHLLAPNLEYYLSGVAADVLEGTYPAIIWFTFFAAGLTVSRLDIRAVRTQAALVAVGLGLAILGYGGSAVAQRAAGVEDFDGPGSSSSMTSDDAVPISPADVPPDAFCERYPDGYVGCYPMEWDDVGPKGEDGETADQGGDLLYRIIDDSPHSGTPFEVAGSTGFALLVIGGALLLSRWRVARGLLWPVAAVGSMALTAYVGHIVAIWLAEEFPTMSGPWPVFLLMTVAACALWKAFLGRGPLERLLAGVARLATDIGADPAPGSPANVPAVSAGARTIGECDRPTSSATPPSPAGPDRESSPTSATTSADGDVDSSSR